tara:strand:- start:813 stop:962 length:150 start_codon:yes stop_codon:yes gene_type:complete
MVRIRDIEQCYKLLLEARNIFSDLNGDSMVEVSKMQKWCKKVDNLVEIK